MNRILLDTSAYAAFLRGDPRVKHWVQSADEVCVSSVVLGELLSGFMQGSREAANRELLARLLGSERVRTLPVDGETAERYALILSDLRRKGTPVPTNDVWIAAGAMQYGLKLVTTDRHFDHIAQVMVVR